MAILIWRREFIVTLGSAAAAWPLAARAQQGERVRRICVLQSVAADDPEDVAFAQGLQGSGWIIGLGSRRTKWRAAEEPSAEESAAAESVERRMGTKGKCGLAKHALDSATGTRITGAGTHAAATCRLDPSCELHAGKPHVRFGVGGGR
jgi:hypothetical protein